MNSSNPIILEVYTHLKNSKDSISLYQIMKCLEEKGFDLSDSSNSESSDLILFRKNFIVMNALYQLKIDLKGTGYTLYISSLKIFLLNECEQNNLHIFNDCHDDEKLTQYYLNWDNFYGTDERQVDELLSGFWNKFIESNHKYNYENKRVDALQVLGVDSLASWEDTQHAYRHLIKVYHPDKGGDSSQFIKVREAYLILKFTRNMD